jgi:hypothetical protein
MAPDVVGETESEAEVRGPDGAGCGLPADGGVGVEFAVEDTDPQAETMVERPVAMIPAMARRREIGESEGICGGFIIASGIDLISKLDERGPQRVA